MSTPTHRSKKHLERDGWTVGIVEKWNPHARVRQDLFGFADLIAIKPGQTPRLVQVTSGANLASRRAKIAEEPRAAIALAAGLAIEIHGWRKVKVRRGGKLERWAPRIVPVTEKDMACQPAP